MPPKQRKLDSVFNDPLEKSNERSKTMRNNFGRASMYKKRNNTRILSSEARNNTKKPDRANTKDNLELTVKSTTKGKSNAI